ncbi:sugar phosphate isomerase/epimerase family protein [Luteolibacter algae]|uniref:Sugar phosphate isomerase/epimerase family protein n=1 Tax=Luteolibacter algae TaxID=454151 RepID=A0ABW5DDX2_9BACT
MITEISVCTWSLANHLERVNTVMDQSGIGGLHLDVSAAEQFNRIISEKGWRISCMMLGFPQEDYSTLESIRKTGGIIPDSEWPENKLLAEKAIRKTAQLAVRYLSFHAGFIDHTDAEDYRIFSQRMRQLADSARAAGVTLLLETGQESAENLKQFLTDLNHPAVAVNFDPANMILYGKGDPIEAIHILAPWIKHVHIKDAILSAVPGRWGEEVPWGKGDIDTDAFFHALEKIGYTGAVAIEREAGENREQDMIDAIAQMKINV